MMHLHVLIKIAQYNLQNRSLIRRKPKMMVSRSIEQKAWFETTKSILIISADVRKICIVYSQVLAIALNVYVRIISAYSKYFFSPNTPYFIIAAGWIHIFSTIHSTGTFGIYLSFRFGGFNILYYSCLYFHFQDIVHYFKHVARGMKKFWGKR